MPKYVKFDDPLWSQLFSEAAELKKIIWDFRLSSQEKIANYLGDEREILFEDVYKFLSKNKLNPITVPTIDRLGEFEGGYYLVKKISQTFQGIKNIRGEYSKWVRKKLEDEENDENIERELGLVIDNAWQIMFEELKHFSKYINDKETLHKMPLRSYSPRLSRWVQTQRENYKKGILSKERIQALESLYNWNFY